MKSKTLAIDTRENKLTRMAERGGTPNERAVAARKLVDNRTSTNLPAVRSEEAGDVWSVCGVLIRHRNEVRSHLRETALRHFLGHISNGCVVTNRTVSFTDDYGVNDFYTILSWLLKNNLCVKMGSRYQIPSKAAIVRKWNEFVDQMKI
jgi:hypothetical protein